MQMTIHVSNPNLPPALHSHPLIHSYVAAILFGFLFSHPYQFCLPPNNKWLPKRHCLLLLYLRAFYVSFIKMLFMLIKIYLKSLRNRFIYKFIFRNLRFKSRHSNQKKRNMNICCYSGNLLQFNSSNVQHSKIWGFIVVSKVAGGKQNKISSSSWENI